MFTQVVIYGFAGSLDIPSKALEIDLAKAGLHMMIEKPISMRPVEEVERLAQARMPLHYMAWHPESMSSALAGNQS